MRKQSDTSGKTASANRAPAVNPVDADGGPDLVKSFMTKNGSDTFPKDTVDEIVGTISDIPAAVEAPVTDAPAADTPQVDSQGEPVVAPVADAPVVEGAKPGEPAVVKPVFDATKVEKPADAPVAAAPAPAVEPAKPSYAADEKIYLVDGNDPWTREQVVAALHERATLQPRAQEAEQFTKLFGYDYAKAKEQWEPILAIMRAEPEKTAFLDTAIHADAETVDYMRRSAEWFNSAEGLEARGLSGQPARAAAAQPQQTADPRLTDALKYIEQRKQQDGIDRANREWNTVFEKYPFFRTDAKALEGLKATANVLYELDRKAGKDDLECRGLIDALNMNQAIYDGIKIARNHADAPAAVAHATVDPNKGPEALLGSNGPAPSGAVRQQKTKDYTGNPDEAVAAFLQEHPGQ